jgi:hypothetical protein
MVGETLIDDLMILIAFAMKQLIDRSQGLGLRHTT